jgi:hypothetical protein
MSESIHINLSYVNLPWAISVAAKSCDRVVKCRVNSLAVATKDEYLETKVVAYPSLVKNLRGLNQSSSRTQATKEDPGGHDDHVVVWDQNSTANQRKPRSSVM